MRTFVNQFQVASTDDQTEITLLFSQVSPVIPNDGSNISETKSEEVASLVMTKETALSLINVLKNIITE
jgi:hypothetical protein